MRRIRTLAAAVLAWGALGAFAEAAPMSSWFGTSSYLSAWYANQSNHDGGFYAPANAPAPAFANTNWYNSPTYLTSLGVVTRPAVSPPVPAAPAPVVASVPASSPQVSAFINFGSAPYAESSTLTTGTAQAWYNSPSVTQAFGGTPTADQQASFTQSVLANIQKTFQLSGMNISLTTNPSVTAAHTMSVVSATSYPGNPNAIGITDVGANGYSFIDKLAYANSPDQLAWAVAHNLSHELMHALGVSSHPDQSGQYLDSGTATWSMLLDPNTKFSPDAVQLIHAATGASGPGLSSGAFSIDGAQLLEAPVPEPATLVLWTVAGLGGIGMARRRSRIQAG